MALAPGHCHSVALSAKRVLFENDVRRAGLTCAMALPTVLEVLGCCP
ncbi:MAG: hypothetical protein ACXVXZ_11710 [Mycobacteriaceae bacterium]